MRQWGFDERLEAISGKFALSHQPEIRYNFTRVVENIVNCHVSCR